MTFRSSIMSLGFSRFLVVSGIVFICCFSCVYDELSVANESESDSLLLVTLSENGYSYFQGGRILSPASASPHGDYKLRFNETASSALDASGKLPLNSTFPEGSVIVKEVYSGNIISVLAVMKKSRSDQNANSGWIWAELAPTGEVYFSVKQRGSGCVSCHNDTPNRDLVRSFDFH
jgi:hypothetical protein